MSAEGVFQDLRYRLRVDMRAISCSAASVSFLLLFPGYALYHYAVASDWVPPFLGGLFGPVSLLAALVCVAVSFWLLRRSVWGGLSEAQFFLISWTYFLVWTLAGTFSVANEAYSAPALRESASTLVVWLAMFFTGAFYSVDTVGRRRAIFAAAIAIIAVMLHAVAIHQSALGPLLVFGGGTDQEMGTTTYQGIGRSVMVTALVLAALAHGYGRKFAVLSIAAGMLLSLGSRAHFFSILCVIVATMFFAGRQRRGRLPLLIFLMLATPVLVAGWSLFLETRAAEVLDLSSSTSWQGRQGVQEIALDVIRTHPLLGDFAYHLRDIGEGGYAHNALSAWTQFGVVGFGLYAALILYFTFLSFAKLLSRDRDTTLWQIAFTLNFCSLIMAVASEQVFSEVPALAWGFAVNALLSDRSRVYSRHG